MSIANDTGVPAGRTSGRTCHARRLRGLAATGFVATLVAMVATTLVAAWVMVPTLARSLRARSD